VDRHIPFFELSKACALPACPLCSIVSARAGKYLDNLLFEHVSDRPFRRSFRAAGGFCSEHAERLASYRDGLAVAILYRDVLADQMGEGKRKRAFGAKEPCPVCVERRRIEDEYLGFIAEARGESEEVLDLRKAFEAGRGLCLHHYIGLRERHARLPGWLVAFQEGKFASLLKRADAFIELSSYGHQDEFEALSTDDKLVWKELVETARKRPGL
jgi:hypothetical protein